MKKVETSMKVGKPLKFAASRYLQVLINRSPLVARFNLRTGVEEVSRLEMSKKIVLENIREGFAVAYDRLVTDLSTVRTFSKMST